MNRFRNVGEKVRRYQGLLLALGSLVSAALFVHLFGAALMAVGPFHVVAQAHPAWHGSTSLRVPPFGEVAASTHQTPVRLEVTLEGLDLTTLGDYIKSPSLQTRVIGDAMGAIRPMVTKLTLKALALGALGGAFAPFLFGRRSKLALVGGASLGLSLVALTGALTGATYDQTAFRNPSYRGVLEAAPWMVGFLERSWDKVNDFGEELEALATNLASLSAQTEQLQPLADPNGELKILHVSDIHSNPAGVKFVREVVKAFGVDAVIDTGDLTDFGTPVEAQFIQKVVDLGVPYYLVPGNHDSADLVQALKRKSPIRVLDGNPRDLQGLLLVGVADPSSTSSTPEVNDAQIDLSGDRLVEVVTGLARVPDIVAVHNPRTAESLIGKVPVVLAGHTHTLVVRKRGTTTYINAGTSGAAGVRGFQSREDVPYTVALLHFRGEGGQTDERGYRLQAVDTITVSGRSGGFALQRFLTDTERNPN